MRQLLYTIAIIISLATVTVAQETGVFKQYYINPVLINAGATGFDNQHEFILSYRNAWSGFDGSPRTYTLLYNGPVGERMGLGGQLTSDRIGKYRTFTGSANFAYKFGNDDFDFGAGIQTGFQQLRLDNVSGDKFIDNSDELLAEGLDGVTLFDASFGFYGESLPNLVRTRLTNISGNYEDPNEEFNYIFYAGYRFDVEEHDFKIEPSIAINNIRRVPFSVDINVKLSFLDEQLVGGITYSVSEINRFGLLLGTRINELRIYYSYDVGFGNFQEYNNGSHEITINYLIPGKSDASE
jgi:type IX secretion system PorP/SprF family membrane protein